MVFVWPLARDRCYATYPEFLGTLDTPTSSRSDHERRPRHVDPAYAFRASRDRAVLTSRVA